jgi:hypothetical protein
LDFYHAEAKQVIILLDDEIYKTSCVREARRFGDGDILLAEDISVNGYNNQNTVQTIHKSLFVTL